MLMLLTKYKQLFIQMIMKHFKEKLKVLTMISTVVLPMTLIAGIYGMNFELLVPDQKNPAGFPIALGLMLVTGVTSFTFFFWKRWM